MEKDKDMENLSNAVTKAARQAFLELFKNKEKYYCCVLVTAGEAFCPIVSAWSFEAFEKFTKERGKEYAGNAKYSYGESPYFNFGYEYFDEARKLFNERKGIDELSDEDYEKEFDMRLSAMENAMKRLDEENIFSINQKREDVYINVEVMPPDASNTERALRLNKKENINEWLEMEGEL